MNMKVANGYGGMWTPANIVTMIRVVLVPLWLLVAELCVPAGDSFSLGAMGVCLLYVLISLTDKLDGYLARSRGEVTTFGKFLDPIADKLAVTVALIYLLEQNSVSIWVVFVILTREFMVSGLRMVVASAGVVVAASNLGKWKTATTMVALCGILFCRALPQPLVAGTWFEAIFQILMWVAVALTAWSGIDYLVKCWPYLGDSAPKARPRTGDKSGRRSN